MSIHATINNDYDVAHEEPGSSSMSSLKATAKRKRPQPFSLKSQMESIGIRAHAMKLQLWDLLSNEERKALGDDLGEALVKYRSTIGMWCKLHGVGPDVAALQIGHLIGWLNDREYKRLCNEIQPHLEAMKPAKSGTPHADFRLPSMHMWDQLVRDAVRRRPLVLVSADGELKVHWHSASEPSQPEIITVSAHQRPALLMIELVERRLRGGGVVQRHLPMFSLKDNCSRLKKALPASLAQKIKPMVDPKGYRLALEAEDISTIVITPDWIKIHDIAGHQKLMSRDDD